MTRRAALRLLLAPLALVSCARVSDAENLEAPAPARAWDDGSKWDDGGVWG